MRIIKKYQGTVPENKILNTYSNSQTDVYASKFINGDVLYENEEGTNGTVNLNDDLENYKRIKIFYYNKNHTGAYSSEEVDEPNGKLVNLSQLVPLKANSRVYLDATTISCSDSSITIVDSYNWAYQSSPYAVGDANMFYITKVIGYKY